MFIDFLTLMLVNMSAGLVLLAWYLAKGIDDPDQQRWAPAFAVPGIIAFFSGLRITWFWPLPGSYNMAFGETSVLLGILLLGAAWSLAAKSDLIPHSVFAFFAGLTAVVVGAGIIAMQMTAKPILSGLGFILTGLAGVFAGVALHYRGTKLVRIIGVIALLGAAGIWAFTGYMAYWMHLESLARWVPK